LRIVRDIALLAIALLVAYGGGYYFGRHPESLRELVSSKSVVIATTEERIFTREVQNWLEDRWGHSIIVLLISDTEIQNRLNNSDLIVAPRSVLKPFESQLQPLPSDIPTDWIDSDFLLEGDQSLPLLWKLVKIDENRQRLVKLSIAWTPRTDSQTELVHWLMSRNVQLMMSKGSGYTPVRHDLLEEAQMLHPLRRIPLSNLIWQ